MRIKQQEKNQIKDFLNEKQAEQDEKIKIYSAHKLSQDEMKHLYETFPWLKDRDIENMIDNDLIAGIVLEKGSKRIDLSLTSFLQELKKVGYEST